MLLKGANLLLLGLGSKLLYTEQIDFVLEKNVDSKNFPDVANLRDAHIVSIRPLTREFTNNSKNRVPNLWTLADTLDFNLNLINYQNEEFVNNFPVSLLRFDTNSNNTLTFDIPFEVINFPKSYIRRFTPANDIGVSFIVTYIKKTDFEKLLQQVKK